MRKFVTAVALATALGTGTAANAAVSGDYGGSGIAIRNCQYTSCTRLGLGYPGQGATIYCFVSGTNVNGNPYWDYHRNNSTGVTGYSADYYMVWFGTLYHC